MKLDEALKEYLMHIRINEGKSRRTGISYEEDLKQYTAWLKEKGIKDTKKITSDLVEDFIVEQQKAKASASVVRMASSIRSFHRDLSFMHDEKDPSLNLEVHKDTKRLPVFCTVDEINRLMSSFDDEDPKQYLDHAILEMIYACGLRVSEVTTLTLNRVDLDAGKCRVLGKGDKERIVPIPDGSVAFLKGYRDIVRPVYLKGRSNLFFLNLGDYGVAKDKWVMLLIPLLLLMFFYNDEEEPFVYSKGQRWFFGTVVFVVVGLIWTAMYLSFTTIGNTTIGGVQARYYLPVLLPVSYALYGNRIKFTVKPETIRKLALGTVIFFETHLIYQLIILGTVS